MTVPREGAVIDVSLRSGSDVFAIDFERRFSAVPTLAPERIGGLVSTALYEGHGTATIASLGLERVIFPGEEPLEVYCEVRAGQHAAAAVAVTRTVRRMVEELGGPLPLHEPWIVAHPFVAGTKLHGIIAVDGSWRGMDMGVFDAAGRRRGRVIELVLLTENEAIAASEYGDTVLTQVASRRPGAFRDINRNDLVDPTGAIRFGWPRRRRDDEPEALPAADEPSSVAPTPDESVAPVVAAPSVVEANVVEAKVEPSSEDAGEDAATTPALGPIGDEVLGIHLRVSRYVRRQLPIGWLQRGEDGVFVGWTLEEPEGYLDDPDNFEWWSLGVILFEQPDLVPFATSALPGSYAKRVLSHWEYGTLDEV